MSNQYQEGSNNQEENSSPLSQDQYAQEDMDHGNAGDGVSQDGGAKSADTVTLRSLLTTKGAGVVIGKAGKTVEQLREETGARAGVSKVIHGVNDRVLTISGTVEQVHKAYGFIAKTFLESPNPTGISSNTASLRLLISNSLMGSIIGRQGSKIKQIQDISGVRMTANKDMLPQSTERIVEVEGSPESISLAVAEIAKSLKEDWERGSHGTILYDPKVRSMNYYHRVGGNRYPSNGGGHYQNGGFHQNNYDPHYSQGAGRRYNSNNNNDYDDGRYRRTGRGEDFFSHRPDSTYRHTANDPNAETKAIPIPSDMVGCIIGKGGSKISEIRQQSGCKISIEKVANEAGERLFTCTGTPEANEKALELLLKQLEIETRRRSEREATEEQ